MLNPAARLIYLDELRPPPGYRLDRAVVTTYSLDMMSLLMAPLSMAMLDARRDNEGRLDPVGALEALRRTSDLFVVFCQKGRISVPPQQQLLYSCLEPVVVETAARNGGAFHPKTWLLRFLPDDKAAPVRYRFLCLSRNLTFDRSWDTALVLDGEVMDRQNAYSRNRPLSTFVAALPGMATEAVPKKALEHVELLAEEVLRVHFQVPEGFCDEKPDDLVFMPMGIGRRMVPPTLSPAKRLLIVSPFLSDDWLRKGLHGQFPSKTTLVSRADSLDAIGESTYKALVSAGTRLFAFAEMAERDEADEEGGAEGVVANDRLSGLHAKLYAAEQGWEGVRLWTGSANATAAAFYGSNVEFMVGLRWLCKQKGIEVLLGSAQDENSVRKHGAASLADLIVPYERDWREEDPVAATRRRLDDELEAARQSLCQAVLQLEASPQASGFWEARLRVVGNPSLPSTITGDCWLVSMGSNNSKPVNSLLAGSDAVFQSVTTQCLTRFVAFRLEASAEEQTVRSGFVLKVHAMGFPEDRDRHILRAIVQNREGFLRLLLLILMNEDTEPGALGNVRQDARGESGRFIEALGLPLFEELVRASSRDPKKIGRISGLLDELTDHGRNQGIVPDDFRELWQVFADYGARRQGGCQHG
ncbi:MAG: phospholipase D family protein [Kiritimatiellae bacterium]|nr:phospholipase D family protein [Kiritimatiellia bacterium]